MSDFFVLEQSVSDCWEMSLPCTGRIRLQGWIRNLRTSKSGVSFLTLLDGSTLKPLQMILNNSLDEYEELIKLNSGAAISVEGALIATPERQQDREFVVDKVLSFSGIDDAATYPLAPKTHSLEFLREVAHLRPRALLFQAITKLRSHLFQSIHEFFREKKFHWIAAPIITSADCEGAGELFQIVPAHVFTENEIDLSKKDDFFGKPAYLTVSGQLNAECFAAALGKVYTFGPTFRAENSNTTRHLSEFWMLEPEVAFADLSQIMDLGESLIKFLAKTCLDQQLETLNFLEHYYQKPLINQLTMLCKKNYARMTYTQAIEILKQHESRFIQAVHWGMDLGTEHERFLAEEHVKGPVFLINYPKEIKAFYMRANDDGKTVAATDLLVPGMGEILGGSQREERLHALDAQIESRHLDEHTLGWYRDLRRYGSVKHSGFGLGFERLICYFGGIENVRDAISFPRAPKLLNF